MEKRVKGRDEAMRILFMAALDAQSTSLRLGQAICNLMNQDDVTYYIENDPDHGWFYNYAGDDSRPVSIHFLRNYVDMPQEDIDAWCDLIENGT